MDSMIYIWYRMAPYLPQFIRAPIDRLCRRYVRRQPFFAEVDILWFEEDVLPGVRDQGSAGTCYAFALCDVTTAVLAIVSKLQHFIVLAPQWFIDYMPRNRNAKKEKVGTKGVHMGDALRFARDVGIGTEAEFPYMAEPQMRRRHASDAKMLVKIRSFVAEDNKSNVRELLKNGPVAAVLYVDDAFCNHSGTGIYHPPKMSKKTRGKVRTKLGKHIVAVIGAGTTREGDLFCYIQNSWSRSWGYHGLAKVDPSALSCFAYPVEPYIV